MNIYFASSPGKKHFTLLREENVKNILISFHYLKDPQKLVKMLDGYEPERLMIDSGAFSAWSQGAVIDIDEYVNFCFELTKVLSKNIEINFVNLDVLPGMKGFVPSEEEISSSAEKGWDNMLYMEGKGVKVIHTFHQYEDFSILDRLVDHLDYIGISSNKGAPMNSQLAWFKKVFAKIKGTIKTHSFAATSHKQLYGFPFYSADSTSWVTPSQYGRIPIMLNNHAITSVVYKDINDVEKYWKYLSAMGVHVINDPTNWQNRVRIGIATYKQLEVVATKLWLERGVDWSVENSLD